MKYSIFAVTPLEYGIFLCTEPRDRAEQAISDLRLLHPQWEFFAHTSTPDNEAFGRIFSYEQTTKSEDGFTPAKGRPPVKRRNQGGGRWPDAVPGEGEEQAEPEIQGEVPRAGADRRRCSGAGERAAEGGGQ